VRILITNISLIGRSGTEVVTIELARGLAARGHQTVVFAPFLGESASILLADGIAVTNRIEDLPWKPDIIHGQHNIAVAATLARFPDVPALFVMHDAVLNLDRPPITSQIVRVFAVDEVNRERHLRDTAGTAAHVDLLPNAVDLNRFQVRDPLPEQPRRALLLGKNDGHIDAVREAARLSGLRLDEIGPVFGRVVDDLHVRLKDYDIVFASARMALEALAVGCAVIVCDGRGLAGLATSDVVGEWRNDNFGLRLLTRTATVDALLAEIQRYRAHDAALASARIREIASLSDHLDRAETIYRDIVANWKCSSDGQRRHSEALGMFISTWLHDLSFDAVSGNLIGLLEQSTAAIAARDAVIAGHIAAIAGREAELVKRDAELAKRDAEWVKRDAELAKRDAEIAQRDTVLNSRLRLVRQLWRVTTSKLGRRG
jgi:glycosyltransferase involved in cell wall biosynthesis